MAIDLLQAFMQTGQSVMKKENTASTKEYRTFPQNMQIMQAIKALRAGQTLQGEILSVNGEDVKLAVMKEVIIEAKLAQSMNLTPGTLMTFQVKSNQKSGLSLMPLFTNTAVDPSGLKALDMAGIPVNERTVAMVQTLMEKGMPIDKQALQEVYRDVISNKDVDVKDIVTLRQMKIPVTAENVKQLSLYENNKHFLLNTFDDIGKALGEQIKSFLMNKDGESATSFLQNLKAIFSEVSFVAEADGKEVFMPLDKGEPFVSADQSETGNQDDGKVVIREEMQGKDDLQTKPEADLPLSKPEIPAEEKQAFVTSKKPQDGMIAKEEKPSYEVITKDEIIDWDQAIEQLVKEKNPKKAEALFTKLWKTAVKQQWMMEPEIVMEKDKVQDFYQRLEQQVKQLEHLVKEQQSVSPQLAKTIQNTSSNLEFMNQLNQMHAYIQLPLKLTNQSAHGELYVYTNKKALSQGNNKVSALLHLGMEHLGNMDIYVSLEDKKVNTNFILEKEENLVFLEQHMDMLTGRLQNRGYDCQAKAMVREKEAEPIMKAIEKEAGPTILLSTQSFDMRA